ncbi:MAG: hypothetical protein SFY95_01330, partial [Planctomycetota bacterium]|nr:hypothetical protein [Planctomycetota bacterium]
MSEPGPQQGRQTEGEAQSGGKPPAHEGPAHSHGHHHFHGALSRLRSWFDPVEAAAVLKRARQRQRVTRRVKRAAWITAAVAGGLLGSYWLVTQSFLTRWVVLAQIRPQLEPMGLDVAASGVRWMGGTWVELRGARVTATGIEGRAGTLFQARSLRVRIDPDAITGKAQGAGVLEVELDEPVVRVSVNPAGEFNIAKLTLPSADKQVGVLPRVEVNGGAIEMGEHELDGTYRPLQRIEVSGLVERDPSDREYRIRFRELPGRAPGEASAEESGPAPLTGMRVEGRFDADELELRLDNVDFSAWSAERVPSRYREYYRRMDLKGKGRAQMAYRFARGGVVAGSRVTLDLEDVEVGLPPQALGTDDTGEAWARMRGVRGLIDFDAGRIIADISGKLEELPYKVRVRWDGPEPDAAFRALVEAGPFTLLEKPRILRFASDTVRYRLAQFGNPTGQVESLVQVEREAPARNEQGQPVAAPIRTFGALYLSDVKAKFWRFPYPFENLKGTVRFTEDEIVLEEISGTSPRGATIVATGRISPIDDNAAVNIDVKARGVPLDDLME